MADVVAFPMPSSLEQAIADMALVYRYEFTSPAELQAYIRALADLPADKVARGCEEVVKHERYFPRPAVLRKHITEAAREESAPGRFTLPEVQFNPATGRTEPVFRCRDCQDTGWVQAGPPKRDGIDAETLARYSSVRRCECKRGSA